VVAEEFVADALLSNAPVVVVKANVSSIGPDTSPALNDPVQPGLQLMGEKRPLPKVKEFADAGDDTPDSAARKAMAPIALPK